MSIEADIKEREDRLLTEMTNLAADLARDMAGRAKTSEALEDAERFTAAFDRMSRSVRLSISLRRRLERDDAREASQHRAEVVDLRKSRLRARLRSEIAEADVSFKQSLGLERELDSALAEDALYASFIDLPLDEAISKLRDRLGLQAPPPCNGGGGPQAERSEEPVVEGASHKHGVPAAPSVSRSAARSTSPVVSATGEELKRPAPS